jgi:hypothetical protein
MRFFAAIQTHPPQNRWERFIDDAGRFLDQWGAEAEPATPHRGSARE